MHQMRYRCSGCGVSHDPGDNGVITISPTTAGQSARSVDILRRTRRQQMNYSTRHLRFGWWALATYVSLGIGLEIMHGFKIGWYLDVGNEVRRLMFTLGHFHGTMLALVNIAAGLTIRGVEGFTIKPSVSFALIWAAILLPGGFLLGGFLTYDGDPGTGIWLGTARRDSDALRRDRLCAWLEGCSRRLPAKEEMKAIRQG